MTLQICHIPPAPHLFGTFFRGIGLAQVEDNITSAVTAKLSIELSHVAQISSCDAMLFSDHDRKPGSSREGFLEDQALMPASRIMCSVQEGRRNVPWWFAVLRRIREAAIRQFAPLVCWADALPLCCRTRRAR